ncbi:Uncharacterized protein TCM_016715 [Theobroma cacao]|uniref:Uncharacterized protein n=1 Tax=Theobroma cacao TaxID=3641 RepID=A0A061G730_THECC|nr:Uncharacterized protein TCM_016715 [Theobroma cacao]
MSYNRGMLIALMTDAKEGPGTRILGWWLTFEMMPFYFNLENNKVPFMLAPGGFFPIELLYTIGY